jgi:molecular chaperone HscB
MDPFATLGIERGFDLDLGAVEKTHRELSRTLHPDKHAAGGASERRYALSKAIEVNEAWRVVKDPIRRAEALFTLAGVPVGETNEPKPSPDFLMDMMEQREALADTRAKGDLAAARALGLAVEARGKRAEEALSSGFASAKEDPTLLAPLVIRLGELRFYRRFMDEVSELEDMALERGQPDGTSPASPERGQHREAGGG